MRRIDNEGRLVHEFMIQLGQTGENDALAVMNDSGLTLPQVVTLSVLAHLGPASVSSLAGQLRLSMSATSALVQRLVEQELITRAEDPDDRRQKRIELTRVGAALTDRITTERTSALGRGIMRLPAGLRTELLDVIGRVVAHLRERP